MQHDMDLKSDPVYLSPGASYPLPLKLTSRGSREACDLMLLRPAQAAGEEGVLYDWGILEPRSILFVCPHDTPGKPMWMCCAEIKPKPLKLESLEHETEEKARRRQELLRFDLPVGEVLQHCWTCVLHGRAVPEPGWLYLSQSYLCFLSRMTGHQEKIELDSIELLVKGSSLVMVRAHHCIEVVLSKAQHSRRLTFGHFASRADTLAVLHAARLEAQREAKSELRAFKPLLVRLRAPIVLASLLPCALHVSLKQEASVSADELVSNLAHEEVVSLEPQGSREVHMLHAMAPLRIQLWLDGEAYESARLHAELHKLKRPKEEGAGERGEEVGLTHVVYLHPPHKSASSENVRLKLHLLPKPGGSCVLSIGADHWLINNTSLPLELHDAAPAGGAVLHAHGPGEARPFSLSTELSFVRVGLRAEHKEGMGSANERLSKRFSVAAVGNDMPLEAS